MLSLRLCLVFLQFKLLLSILHFIVDFNSILSGDHCGHDCMVVGYTTTCAISAYHHESCDFEPRYWEVYSIQHYVIKYISDLQQVSGFHGVLRFPPPIKLTLTI